MVIHRARREEPIWDREALAPSGNDSRSILIIHGVYDGQYMQPHLKKERLEKRAYTISLFLRKLACLIAVFVKRANLNNSSFKRVPYFVSGANAVFRHLFNTLNLGFKSPIFLVRKHRSCSMETAQERLYRISTTASSPQRLGSCQWVYAFYGSHHLPIVKDVGKVSFKDIKRCLNAPMVFFQDIYDKRQNGSIF